jgi:hypothetical protein
VNRQCATSRGPRRSAVDVSLEDCPIWSVRRIVARRKYRVGDAGPVPAPHESFAGKAVRSGPGAWRARGGSPAPDRVRRPLLPSHHAPPEADLTRTVEMVRGVVQDLLQQAELELTRSSRSPRGGSPRKQRSCWARSSTPTPISAKPESSTNAVSWCIPPPPRSNPRSRSLRISARLRASDRCRSLVSCKPRSCRRDRSSCGCRPGGGRGESPGRPRSACAPVP